LLDLTSGYNQAVFTKQRYSIKFLFFETFLAGCAFAMMREGIARGGEVGWLLLVASILVVGTTLGGLFGSFAGGLKLAIGTLFSIGFFVSLFGPPIGFLLGLVFIFALAAARQGGRQNAAS
jgi:hypothetical protein